MAELASFLAMVRELDPDGPIELQHFEAAIAVDVLDLFAAAVDREVVQFLRLNPKHRLEALGGDAAKAGALLVDLALAGGLVKIDAPAVCAHHAEVDGELVGREVLIQVGAIAGGKLTASPTVLNTLPSCHAGVRAGCAC
jgi:hypothetical protein